MKIKLFNRDGADMWLEPFKDNLYKLCVDDDHIYCLQYMRIIGHYPTNIEAIDPSGGPFLSVGDYVDKTHKIDKFESSLLIKLSETNNN